LNPRKLLLKKSSPFHPEERFLPFGPQTVKYFLENLEGCLFEPKKTLIESKKTLIKKSSPFHSEERFLPFGP